MALTKKQQFAQKVAEKTQLDRKTAEVFVYAVFETVLEEVIENGSGQIGDLGEIEKAFKKARTARNPQTGEPVEVAAKYAPKFKPSKKLKDTLKALEV
ncbi:transcriptional regulator [Peribacillus asahii]|uniref:Transcriptional regulator n=1 Tax=Peribacillus asahii TaxID=228899 RepID=A0A3T0KTF6_9BACI|nr:HU family DNA-binding protein [Peribacillus asahii]AZV43709.1 transcriptional regulator [Peribacillus asahii]